MLYSFSKVLDIPTENLAKMVGHDGTEKILNLNSPNDLRGFHPQEFIDIGLRNGKSLTIIELLPCSRHGTVVWDDWERLGVSRFRDSMDIGNGVLCGTLEFGIGHAVAWVNGAIDDIRHPDPYAYEYCRIKGFKPLIFFLCMEFNNG